MSETGAAPDIITFGCRLNIVESDAMARFSRTMPDAVVVNTCAVTADSARKSRQAVRRALREKPNARVMVSGCASELDRPSFEGLSDRVTVIRNAAKTDAKTWTALGAPSIDPIGIERTHTRGFVAVQNGCDHRCTFCVIPFGRGASRSVPIEQAVTNVRRLVEEGHADVILTGVDLTSWGNDLGDLRLGDLVKAILRDVSDLKRLRLSSLDCIEIDDALFDAIATQERLMPHLHLSLQSGDNLILKRMKRRHSRGDAVRLCQRLRRVRPDMVFGADLIAGFPTETDAMAENTRALSQECGLTHLHVFPYSPRPGTPAARMPPVAPAVVAERAARLRTDGDRSLAVHLDRQIDRVIEILVERGCIGRAADFTPVRVPDSLAPGSFATRRIVGHDGRRLFVSDDARH